MNWKEKSVHIQMTLGSIKEWTSVLMAFLSGLLIGLTL